MCDTSYFASYATIKVKKGVVTVKIIVHYPKTLEKQMCFDACVAKFHAEYVAQYIEKLNCPTEQKLRLIDSIAQTILEAVEEKGKDFL